MPGLVSTTSVGESAAPSTSTSADPLVSSSLGSGVGEAADPQLTPTPLTDDGIHPTCQPVDNNLPAHVPMTNPQFRWGELNASAFTSLLDTAYREVVHWRRNCFTIPKGNTGKAFVNELARLFAAFASGTTLESVSIKATIALPHLVLQKPHRSSKPKDHASSLERRMKLWEQGDLTELLKEGIAIQKRLSSSRHQGDEQQVARSFAKLMFQRKTQAANRSGQRGTSSSSRSSNPRLYGQGCLKE